MSLSPKPGDVAKPRHLECGVRRLGSGVVAKPKSLGCVVVARPKRMDLVWLPDLDNLGVTCLLNPNNMNLI